MIEEFYKKPAENYAVWAWVTCCKSNGFVMRVEDMIRNYVHYTKSTTPLNTLYSIYYRMDKLHNSILKEQKNN